MRKSVAARILKKLQAIPTNPIRIQDSLPVDLYVNSESWSWGDYVETAFNPQEGWDFWLQSVAIQTASMRYRVPTEISVAIQKDGGAIEPLAITPFTVYRKNRRLKVKANLIPIRLGDNFRLYLRARTSRQPKGTRPVATAQVFLFSTKEG